MRKRISIILLLTGIIATSLNVFADNDPTIGMDEKVINLSNDNGNNANNETLQVPVTATVSNNLLNVHFTGNIPTATISVQNALTGATVNRQTMTGVQGVTFSVPVSGLTMGTVTVTNEQSGESVSGDFEVKAEE